MVVQQPRAFSQTTVRMSHRFGLGAGARLFGPRLRRSHILAGGSPACPALGLLAESPTIEPGASSLHDDPAFGRHRRPPRPLRYVDHAIGLPGRAGQLVPKAGGSINCPWPAGQTERTDPDLFWVAYRLEPNRRVRVPLARSPRSTDP